MPGLPRRRGSSSHSSLKAALKAAPKAGGHVENALLRDVHGVLLGPKLDEAKNANRQSEDVQRSMQRKLQLMRFQALAPCICSLQQPIFIFLLWTLFVTLIWFDGIVWALVAYSLCRLSGPRLDTHVWTAGLAGKLGMLA